MKKLDEDDLWLIVSILVGGVILSCDNADLKAVGVTFHMLFVFANIFLPQVKNNWIDLLRLMVSVLIPAVIIGSFISYISGFDKNIIDFVLMMYACMVATVFIITRLISIKYNTTEI